MSAPSWAQLSSVKVLIGFERLDGIAEPIGVVEDTVDAVYGVVVAKGPVAQVKPQVGRLEQQPTKEGARLVAIGVSADVDGREPLPRIYLETSNVHSLSEDGLDNSKGFHLKRCRFGFVVLFVFVVGFFLFRLSRLLLFLYSL